LPSDVEADAALVPSLLGIPEAEAEKPAFDGSWKPDDFEKVR
jgi:hypothetical protein